MLRQGSTATTKRMIGKLYCAGEKVADNYVPFLTSDEYRLGKAKRTTLEAKSSQRLGSATDPMGLFPILQY